MNKEKLKQFMEEEGYEEISHKEWEKRDDCVDIYFDKEEKRLCFKPKEKPQETEIDKIIDEVTQLDYKPKVEKLTDNQKNYIVWMMKQAIKKARSKNDKSN